MSTITTIPSLNVAGRVFVDTLNDPSFKMLKSKGLGTNGRYNTFVDEDNVRYQVPTGKTFRVLAIEAFNASVGGTGTFQAKLLYGDDFSSSENTATPPTNAVIEDLNNDTCTISCTGVSTIYQLALQWDIPADKYPHWQLNSSDSGKVRLIGYEI